MPHVNRRRFLADVAAGTAAAAAVHRSAHADERAQPGQGNRPATSRQVVVPQDVRDVPDIPLQNRRHIGIEPGPASFLRPTREHLRESPSDDSAAQFWPQTVRHAAGLERSREARIDEAVNDALGFSLRERPEGQNFHATRERFRRLRQDERMGRPGEQEAPRRAPRVGAALDGPEDVRDALNFVQDHAWRQGRDEPVRVAPRPRQYRGVVERPVLRVVAFGRQAPDEGRLARLPRSLDEDDGSVSKGGQDGTREMSTERGRK